MEGWSAELALESAGLFDVAAGSDRRMMSGRDALRDVGRALLVSIGMIGALVALGVIALLIWMAVDAIRYPSDEDMVRTFQANDAQFEGLLDGYTDADLKALGIERVEYSSFGDGTTTFTVLSRGLVGTDDWKGYLYSDHPVSPLVIDTDDNEGQTYHELGNGWYIFHLAL